MAHGKRLFEEYNFAVFATQGGGLVRRVEDTFIFAEKPNCPGLDVGNELPAEWSIVPVNRLAYEDCEKHRDCL